MRICFVAEKGYLAYGAAIRDEMERERPGFLSIFLLETPPSYEGWVPPPADLYLLPAPLFLDLAPEARPTPLFAYGCEELILESMNSGCADYLREPLEGRELEARARKLFSFRLRLGGALLCCSAERGISSETGAGRKASPRPNSASSASFPSISTERSPEPPSSTPSRVKDAPIPGPSMSILPRFGRNSAGSGLRRGPR